MGDDKYLVGEKTESINLEELIKSNEINNDPIEHIDEPANTPQPEGSKPHDKALFENLLEDSDDHPENTQPQLEEKAETDTESEKEPVNEQIPESLNGEEPIVKSETGRMK